MLQKLTKRKEGFTIIEVMIVLAIAGLILLIVFLAVPALQRNSRNTQRKNDVQAALGAISEYESNNAGTVPAVGCGGANPYSVTAGNCAAPTGTPAQFKQGYYTAAPAFAAGTQAALGTDTMRIVTGATCNANGSSSAGASRAIAVQYQIEGNGQLVSDCQES